MAICWLLHAEQFERKLWLAFRACLVPRRWRRDVNFLCDALYHWDTKTFLLVPPHLLLRTSFPLYFSLFSFYLLPLRISFSPSTIYPPSHIYVPLFLRYSPMRNLNLFLTFIPSSSPSPPLSASLPLLLPSPSLSTPLPAPPPSPIYIQYLYS